jgi:pilus assembly protein CpaD
MTFPLRSAAVLAVAVLLAGCTGDRGDITGSIGDTPQQRHPIQVARGIATMDLLPGGGPGGLTDRQMADVRGFSAGWTASGRGQLLIEVPTGAGPVTDSQSAYAVKEIRRAILSTGVPAKAVAQTHYPANGPGHLAPVRLSYPVLQAKVPHECSQAVEDAGYSETFLQNENRQPYNFGCAYQQNLAATVADPEDFIRPRAEDAPSSARRADVMGKYRKGQATPGAETSKAESTQSESSQ